MTARMVVAWRYQAIPWSNVDSASIRFCGNFTGIAHYIYIYIYIYILDMSLKIIHRRSQTRLPLGNELVVSMVSDSLKYIFAYQSTWNVIKWKHFPCYWPFVLEIPRSLVNAPHKGQWRGVLMFSLICVWINGLVNNRETGNLIIHHTRYGFTVMTLLNGGWDPSSSRVIKNVWSHSVDVIVDNDAIEHLHILETKNNVVWSLDNQRFLADYIFWQAF